MDDLQFGTRDKRDNWRPNEPLQVGPLLDSPWRLRRILTWLPGYIFPWNALFFALALVFWSWLTPSRATLETLQPGWILYILLTCPNRVVRFQS